MTQSSERLTLARAARAAQPFSLLLGTVLHSIDPGEAELRLPLRHELQRSMVLAMEVWSAIWSATR